MKIEQIRIKRFKVFKDVEIRNLPKMCVFLGANGSGKSTLSPGYIKKEIYWGIYGKKNF
jgi:predicted ATPase